MLHINVDLDHTQPVPLVDDNTATLPAAMLPTLKASRSTAKIAAVALPLICSATPEIREQAKGKWKRKREKFSIKKKTYVRQ